MLGPGLTGLRSALSTDQATQRPDPSMPDVGIGSISYTSPAHACNRFLQQSSTTLQCFKHKGHNSLSDLKSIVCYTNLLTHAKLPSSRPFPCSKSKLDNFFAVGLWMVNVQINKFPATGLGSGDSLTFFPVYLLNQQWKNYYTLTIHPHLPT